MKLTKKLEAEILKDYKAYWEAYLKGDMKTFASKLDDDITVFGTAISEVFKNKKETLRFYTATADQMAGKAQFRNRQISLHSVDNNVLINEQCDLYFLIDGKWNFYGHARVSGILKQTKAGWKLVHQHASFPDTRAEEGEQVNAEKIKKENLQLRDAVKRRTIELEEKNRELEIETALEKVRSVAMGMKEATDMPSICKTIAEQLEILGLKEIRNVQTAVFNRPTTIYLNYEYFPLNDKSIITEVDYMLQPDVKAFAKRMLKASGTFYTRSFNREELREWSRYQKKENQYRDPRQQKAKSLHYYFFSIENAALGISIYTELNKEEINIFKKFRNVFELAYKRFIDIQKAEAQAREAQIEVAVERVRAKALAMHRSEEISNVANILRNELGSLNIPGVAAATIILQQENGKIRLWDITSVVELKDGFHFAMDFLFDLKGTKPIDWIRRIWDSKEKYFVYKQDKKDFKRTLVWTAKYDPGFVENARGFLETNNIKNTWHPIVPLSHGKLSLDLFQEPVAEVESILTKMAAAFDLAYKRFLDLKKAEAQAREAQIEAALERVRSKTNAMHRSEDLHKVIKEVHDQLRLLEFRFDGVDFMTDYNDKGFNIWLAAQQHTFSAPIYVPVFDHKIFRLLKKVKKEEKDFFTFTLDFQEKNKYIKHLIQNTIVKNVPEEMKQHMLAAKGWATSCVVLKNIILSITNLELIPYTDAENAIIKRFAHVFQQSYTRFLDLQKAEAQTREAQIEAALERVRARTMGMHKTDELLDAAELVSKELSDLGIISMNVSYAFVDENKKSGSYYSLNPVDGKIVPIAFVFPHTETQVMRSILASWKKKEVLNIIELNEQATLKHQTYIGEHIQKQLAGNGIPFSVESFLEVSPKKAVLSTFNFKHGYLFNIGGIRLTQQQEELLLRFTKVFEQTYIRFLDLQKAEAQAREAQIETALERVRSRTMAMHRSEEIADVVGKILGELRLLDLVLNRVLIWIFNAEEKYISWWSANPEAESNAESYRVDYNEHPVFLSYFEAWQKRLALHSYTLSGDNKKTWEDHLFTNTGLSKLPVAVRNGMREEGTIFTTSTTGDYGLIMVGSYEPLSNANTDIIQRFGRVFQQSYRRYLDVQKAEAQARESQVQLALERIRARTMAMQKSSELSDAAYLLFQQFKELGAKANQFSIGIINDEEEVGEMYATIDGDKLLQKRRISIHEPIAFKKAYTAWKEKKENLLLEISGKDLETYNIYRNKIIGRKIFPEEIKAGDRWIILCTFFSSGVLSFASSEPAPEETFPLLERFSKVFDQTYTRFLDLQKAEAQAREAQIEAALERVRAKTMAMHKSQDLLEVVKVLGEQFELLGFKFHSVNFDTDSQEKDLNIWLYNVGSAMYPGKIHIPYIDHPFFNRPIEAYKKGGDFHTFLFTKEEKDSLFDHLYANTVAKHGSEERKKFTYAAPGFAMSIAVTKNTRVTLANYNAEPFSDDENAILRRFANVFEQSYTRFLDLQKAEEQAKEAKIQAALEKVRSRSMGMQKSDELAEVVAVLYKQFEELDFGLYQVLVSIYDKKNSIIEWWSRGFTEVQLPQRNIIPIIDHPFSNDLFEKWEDGVEYYPHVLEGELKKSWEEYLFTQTDLKNFPQEVKDTMRSIDKVYLSDVFMKYGSLQAAGPTPLPDDKADILKRFVKVLDLAYTRMKDLQTAELQAREAQIELGLERVRSRAMAMQTSDELNELIGTVFTELTKLDLVLTRCVIQIYEGNEKGVRWWMANSEAPSMPVNFFVKYTDLPFFNDFLRCWNNRSLKWQYILEGENKIKTDDYLFNETELSHLPGFVIAGMKAPDRVYLNSSFNTFGDLTLASLEPLSDEHFDILLRFAKVFDLTYTRFNDLKQAEAQAREAQIELGLERVRARAMAMQRSDELKELIATLSAELGKLDIILDRSFIIIYDTQTMGSTWWMANPETPSEPIGLFVKYHEHPSYLAHIEAWKNRNIRWEYILEADTKKTWDQFLFVETELSRLPEFVIDNMRSKEKVYLSSSFNNFGYLTLATLEPLTNEQFDIMLRFARVFDLTYTRFNDLKQAEAQARESQIQLALERVRARTMAMQRSDELSNVATVLFQQVKSLGVSQWTCGFCIWDIGDTECMWYSGSADGEILAPARFPLTEHPVFRIMDESRKRGDELFIYEKEGEMQADHYRYMSTLPGIRERLQGMLDAGLTIPTFQIDHYANFAFGNLIFITYEHVPEMHDVFKRFAKVFEQAYTRFLDLQKTEAQAREAQIQLALERVRARTMAMQQSDELLGVVSTLYEQLNNLQFDSNACNIIIIDKESNNQRYWVSGFTQKLYPESYNVPYFKHPYIDEQLQSWKEGRDYIVIEYSGKMKQEFDKQFFSQTDFKNIPAEVQKIISALPSAKLSTAFFTYGALQIIGPNQLSEENAAILQRFAKVFDQTYTRFLDLQKAEAQAREAKIEAALERVRSRAMAMHTPDELKDVALELRNQMGQMAQPELEVCAIHLYDESPDHFEAWAAIRPPGDEGKIIQLKAKFPKYGVKIVEEMMLLYRSAKKDYVLVNEGEKIVEWLEQLKQQVPEGYKLVIESLNGINPEDFRTYWSLADFHGGSLVMTTYIPPNEEARSLLRRFANVFGLAYRRFIDLKHAEAQTREAQIELALERVRARTMAMHQTSELQEVIHTVHKELLNLDLSIDGGSFVVINEDVGAELRCWGSGGTADTSEEVQVPHFNMPFCTDLVKGIKRGPGFFTEEFSQKEKEEYFTQLFKHKPWSELSNEQQKETLSSSGGYTRSVAVSKYTSIFIINHHGRKFTEAENDILKRFGKVFEQTYTRFLDLQKAEAQAHEARIEISLERIRARALAMHKSDEFIEVAKVVWEQMTLLGQRELESSVVHLYEEDPDHIHSYRTVSINTDSNTKLTYGHMAIPKNSCEVVSEWLEKFHSDQTEYTIEISGQKQQEWYELLFKLAPDVVNSMRQKGDIHEKRFYRFSKFSGGALLMVSKQEPSEEASYLQRRAAVVFDLAYRRFLDLQKAEAQAREAQIEASLERVRSKTMAMHNSNDVGETVATMFAEFINLGIHTNRCGILIFNDERNAEVWTARSNSEGKATLIIGRLDLSVHNLLMSVHEAWKRKESFHRYDLLSDEIKAYYEAINKSEYYPVKFDLNRLPSKEFHSDFFFPEGAVFAFTKEPIADEHQKIFKRFAGVFGQTYRRYLDLQKAEAQAREAQIEAALERVRAKAMAMHSSKDLAETLNVFYRELKSLSVIPIRCGVALIDKETRITELTTMNTTEQGDSIEIIGTIKMTGHPVLDGVFENWLVQKEYHAVLRGNQIKEYYQVLKPQISYLDYPHDEVQFGYYFMFKEGDVYAWTEKELTEDELNIYRRFTTVISLTYKRYKDLQQAEAQAREAKIEAALERVRSRAMAMHKSDDLQEAVTIMFEEFHKLSMDVLRCGIGILDNDSRTGTVWATSVSDNGLAVQISANESFDTHPLMRQIYEHWQRQEDLVYMLEGQDLIDYYKAMDASKLKLPKSQLLFSGDSSRVQYYYGAMFNAGGLYAFRDEPFGAEDIKIMKRFASVVDLTYKRFFDLQKAEAQAREATIEAALEKVRGKAMAMHNSNDLSVTTSLIIGELRKLGIKPIRCGVGIISKETHKAQLYTATSSADGDSLSVVGWVLLKGHPVLERIYEKFVAGQDYFPELTGDSMRSYYEQLLAGLSVPLPDFNAAQKHYGHFFAVSVGCLYTWSDTRYNEDQIKILKRFASIIDLTFRRYFELQKSEANAREAVKQAALDRVRADIASMRTINDLDRITPLIWNELTILGIPFIRCGVFIMDEAQQLIHTFLSTPDGNAIAAFHLPYDTPGNIGLVIENWRNKKQYVDHWDEEEFIQFAEILMKQGALGSKEQYLKTIPHGGFYLHFFPFLQGMLYVGNTTQLNTEEIELIQHVADAFSTAYARYEDFNRLEAAKKQVENTLTDLKQAQTQLVQSEKMASLGELTAGIAHEIQNPLNFVNNFSDVSNELLEEMKNELEKGNKEDAIAIVEDVKQNLEKILHHGKRADAIVKGMLQHSRTSSGQKEMTDINILADEYLRLAYHGLRAKDKSFNAKFETYFDNNIGKANVIPQDIGRVILNLINNAFYTVTEKKKQSQNGYEPTVTITTSKDSTKIEIKVKDNGNGIPQKVLDKIFQPFFTTKPTGQGTGLGLSLAYDIVTKGHGGELKVETKEGEGSEFIIQLPNQTS